MVSRFDETLFLMDPDRDAPVAGLRAALCGRGPIETGATVLSMQVWLFQRTQGGAVAVATGRSGEDVGSPPERPPFAMGRWMIRTGLDPDSGEFSAGEPVSAMALALVERRDGSRHVEQWNQDVSLHTDPTRPRG